METIKIAKVTPIDIGVDTHISEAKIQWSIKIQNIIDNKECLIDAKSLGLGFIYILFRGEIRLINSYDAAVYNLLKIFPKYLGNHLDVKFGYSHALNIVKQQIKAGNIKPETIDRLYAAHLILNK